MDRKGPSVDVVGEVILRFSSLLELERQEERLDCVLCAGDPAFEASV